MKICLDVGNSHIYGGIFDKDAIKLTFRYASSAHLTSDMFGLFLKDVLEKNGLDSNAISDIIIGSVVPALDYTLIAACKKYFGISPLNLKPGVKTGLKLDIKNPLELGADLIATAVAAMEHFPDNNLCIVDFGTATTISVVSKQKTFLGVSILPGMKLSMEALSSGTAKLADVVLIRPESALGKSTIACIQSGLYYGQIGAIREIISKITEAEFPNSAPTLVSTGGYAHLFHQEDYFHVNIPDLVLHGLNLILMKNR